MSKVDKGAIREDYLRGFSVRMLAAKYNVPRSTIGRWVKQYGWVQEHRQQEEERVRGTRDKTARDTETLSAEPLPVEQDYEMLRVYTQKLLAKADDLLNLDDALAPRDLKSLSSMLLDVRQLLNILSPREAAEQELRLSVLRKQAMEEKKDAESSGIEVVFVGDTEEAAQ